MAGERCAFVDWMKSLGMLMIVYGHSPAGTELINTDPIRSKQLGVAFFVFVTAYCLSREKRNAYHAVTGRLVTVYIVGFSFAMLVSLIGLISFGDPGESNYLPFVFGVNVLLNYFPANPTTWYIGTYLHLLLLWAFCLRRIRIRAVHIVAWVVFSVLARAALMVWAGDFVAYMFFSNWVTVFLFGMWANQRRDVAQDRRSLVGLSCIGVGLLVFAWPRVVGGMIGDTSFPFMQLEPTESSQVNLLITSAAVEFLYFAYTAAIFQISASLPDLRIVRFFARNTLVVFVVHMPVIYWLTPHLSKFVARGWPLATVNVLIYYVALTVLSEIVLRAINLKRLRDRCLARIDKCLAVYQGV